MSFSIVCSDCGKKISEKGFALSKNELKEKKDSINYYCSCGNNTFLLVKK